MSAKSSVTGTPKELRATKPFAWEGIGLAIPQAWDLGALEGTTERGFARIDDPAVARVELRWMPVPRGFDIQASTDRFLAGVEKTGRKNKQTITTKRRTGLGPDARDVDRRGFVWEGPCRALGCLAWHRGSTRAIVVQVLLKNDERALEGVARDVLRSVHEQIGRDRRQWAVYDFVCEVDARMKLVSHRLQSGAFVLEFEGPLGKLRLSRYALANVLLRDRSPTQWYHDSQARRDRRYRDEEQPCRREGHDAWWVHRRRPHWWVRMPAKDVIVWECTDSNQLLCVECVPKSTTRAEELLDRAWTVSCHR